MTGILAKAWNAMLDGLRRARPLRVISTPPRGWRHPWQVTPKWFPAKDKETPGFWAFTVEPGYVSGGEVTASIPTEGAPPETLERIGDDAGETVEAYLSEGPWIRAGGMRALGAAKHFSDGEDDVPEFFRALGVLELPAKTNVETFTTSIEGTGEIEGPYLRAFDVVLYKDRPGMAMDVQVANETAGSFVRFAPIYANTISHAKFARIGQSELWKAAARPTSQDLLLGEAVDATFDEIRVATVFFLSPREASRGDEPDSTWTPYVRHDLFWNLNHAANHLGEANEADLLKNPVPENIAAGAGQNLIRFLIAQDNDIAAATNQFLNGVVTEGRFWTV